MKALLPLLLVTAAGCSAPPLPGPRPAPPLEPAPQAQRSGQGSSFHMVPEVSYLVLDLKGGFSVTQGSDPTTATRISVNDLDLHKDRTFEYGLAVEGGKHRLKVQYMPVGFSGESTADTAFLYKGVTYPAGETLKSDVDFEFWSFGYDYPVGGGTWGDLRVGTQWYYWEYSSRIQGRSPVPRDQDRTFDSFLPGLSLGGDLRYSLFHVRAQAVGAWLSHDNTLVDLLGAVGVRVGQNMNVDIGYRSMAFQMGERESEADLFLRGPFLSGSIRF